MFRILLAKRIYQRDLDLQFVEGRESLKGWSDPLQELQPTISFRSFKMERGFITFRTVNPREDISGLTDYTPA